MTVGPWHIVALPSTRPPRYSAMAMPTAMASVDCLAAHEQQRPLSVDQHLRRVVQHIVPFASCPMQQGLLYPVVAPQFLELSRRPSGMRSSLSPLRQSTRRRCRRRTCRRQGRSRPNSDRFPILSSNLLVFNYLPISLYTPLIILSVLMRAEPFRPSQAMPGLRSAATSRPR